MRENQAHIIDLKYLSETMIRMGRTRDLENLSSIIFDFVSSVISFDMCVIYRLVKSRLDLEVVACQGAELTNLKKRNRFRIGEGAVGWVAQRKQALLVGDVDRLVDFNIRQCKPEDPPIKSFLAVPLVAGDELKGVMSISSTTPGQFKEKQVQLISIIACQLATLMESNIRMQETEHLASQILDNINSGVMVVDNQGRLVAFNKAAQVITGHRMHEVLGRRVDELGLTEGNERLKMMETLETREPLTEVRNRLKRKDGSWVNVRLSTSLLHDAGGGVMGCISIFRDTTENDKLQAQVMRAEKLAAVGRLTAGLAHEMCNPLLPIRTASGILKRKAERLGEDPACQNLLNTIQEEGERLNRFLRNILHLFSGNPAISMPAECSLRTAVLDTVNLMSADLRKRNIDLECRLPEKDATLPFSRDNLKQILLNLILNSADAIELCSNRPRSIKIDARLEGGQALITVSDTGCGLDPGDQGRLFDPFYTTKEEGTGIGLYIVHRLVFEAGGRIEVEGIPGEGSRFVIIAPCH